MSNRRRRLAIALAIASLLVVVGAQFATAAFVVKGRQTSSGLRWKPKLAEIQDGTRVVWKAIDFTHTVTSWGGGWSKNTTISEGEQTSFRFNNTGVFKYRCTLHSTLSSGVCNGMCGKVRVT